MGRALDAIHDSPSKVESVVVGRLCLSEPGSTMVRLRGWKHDHVLIVVPIAKCYFSSLYFSALYAHTVMGKRIRFH